MGLHSFLQYVPHITAPTCLCTHITQDCITNLCEISKNKCLLELTHPIVHDQAKSKISQPSISSWASAPYNFLDLKLKSQVWKVCKWRDKLLAMQQSPSYWWVKCKQRCSLWNTVTAHNGEKIKIKNSRACAISSASGRWYGNCAFHICIFYNITTGNSMVRKQWGEEMH